MPHEFKPPMARDLFLNDVVDQKMIGALTKSIIEINNSDLELSKLYSVWNLQYKPEPILIYIDTYGGYVYQMLGLLGIMEKSKTPIHTVVTGAAMSCGFMILICGHKRFAYKYATPMYHQIGSWHQGKIQDLKEDLVQSEKLQSLIEKIVIQKTKIKKAKLKELLVKKIDWYFTAKKALEYSVIDEIL